MPEELKDTSKTEYLKQKIPAVVLSICAVFIVVMIFLSSNSGAGNTSGSSGKNPATGESSVKGLVINEVMSNNNAAFPDDSGEFYDWIELYNGTKGTISLEGYGLSDTESEVKWIFPKVSIESKGHLIVYLSGNNKNDGLYANFKLKSAGETVVLKDPNGNVVDKVEVPSLAADEAYQRDLEGKWYNSFLFTPGFANTVEGRSLYIESRINLQGDLKINEVMPVNRAYNIDSFGNFSDWIEIINMSDKDIDISGYGLSDDPAKPLKFKFPERILKKGETALVYCSGRSISEKNTELHAGFKLPGDGGSVVLSNKSGIIIDKFDYSEIKDNQAYSLQNGVFYKTTAATPGYPNTPDGLDLYFENADKNKTELVINELMSSNDKYYPVDGGIFYDWVEIKNRSDKAVNLKNYSLSNDIDDLSKWTFPDVTLAPGECFVVVCSGDVSLTTKKFTHANFAINQESDSVYLSVSGAVIDSACVSNIPYRFSYGRSDKKAGFFYISQPTPGKNNNDGKREITDTPSIETKSGVYNNTDKVTIKLSGRGELFYTTDGSEPSENSIKYTGPFDVSKTAIIRAVAIEKEKHKSLTATGSYILSENCTLPVVSVVTDPENLWNYEKGIYVKGPGASSEFPYKGANFWKDWEVPAHIELYEKDGSGFSQNCGLKIFGAYNRGDDKKSFQVKFRSRYNDASSLRYKLFESKDITRFESIVLRSGSQDYKYSMMRDEMMTSLAAEYTSVDVQAYKPVSLYLNGEYWGIYYIREKVNANYVATNYNVPAESVNLLVANGSVISGSNKEYKALIEFVKTHDMRDEENYRYVESKVDFLNYIDYIIAEIYCANTDNGNIKFFMSPEYDGKWRWIFFDLDWAFFDVNHASIYHNIKPSGTGIGAMFDNTLIKNLLNNPEFKDLFLTRLGYNLNNTWSEKNVIARIDYFQNLIKNEIPKNHEKWDLNAARWENQVERLRNFARQRTDIVINEAKKVFKLSEAEMQKYFRRS